MSDLPDPLTLIGLLVALALIPFLAVMVTSFIKLVVVLSLIRNALGIQQIPPNIVLNGIALILTVYIMAPVGFETWDILKSQNLNYTELDRLGGVFEEAQKPLKAFLIENADENERNFFRDTTAALWPERYAQNVTNEHFLVVIPAFTVAELTRAFEIGFMLYLPFIAIDLIVSNILLAMGMVMVSPMTISLPFKLFLFVMVDGWTRLIHGLVLSY
jgi:type III secretion apparatus protein, YscR/HrcR family